MFGRSAPKIAGVTFLAVAYFRAGSKSDKSEIESINKVTFSPLRISIPILPISFCDCNNNDSKKSFFNWNFYKVEGDAEIYYKLYCIYQDVNHPEHNFQKAVAALELAAKEGHVQAQHELGSIYYNNKHMQEAVKYFQLAADQGHSGGQYGLGLCYQNGHGVTQDSEKADDYFALAADQNYPDAIFLIARRLREQGKHPQIAAAYFIRAADKGHKEAQVDAGLCLDNGLGIAVNRTRAAEYYRKAAAQGSLQGQFLLAGKMLGGGSVPQDRKEGLRLLTLCADQGYLTAQYVLASLYDQKQLGTDPAEQADRALHYYKLAADQGHRGAAFETGMFYMDMNDGDKALHYFGFASRNGELAADTLIGRCHIYGIGVNQNAKEGLRIIQESANKGCSFALELLLELYTKGAPGVAQSPELAQKYNDLIAEQRNQGKYDISNRQNHPDFWKVYKW